MREAFGDIIDAIQGAALFDLVTTLTSYQNMACTSFSVPRDAQRGNALHFTMTFQVLRFVDTQTVAALPPRAKPAKHRGAKTGKQVDPKTEQEKQRSLLRSAVKALGG